MCQQPDTADKITLGQNILIHSVTTDSFRYEAVITINNEWIIQRLASDHPAAK